MQKYIVDCIPQGHEGLVMASSAISRKYETAPFRVKGAHLIVELLVADRWPRSAEEFFTRLQVEGMVRSWTKYVEPKSFVQVFDRSNERVKEEQQ